MMDIIYPPYVDPQFQTLIERIHPPRVSVDNDSCQDCTLVKVDSANKHGILLEMVQLLTDLDLIISKSYVSSDGGWLMDVFHVTDQLGRKLTDESQIHFIQQAIGPTRAENGENARVVKTCLGRVVGAQEKPWHTVFEMTGTDSPGLHSEISPVLTDMSCNVVSAHAWTHNTRMACIAFVTDCATSGPITDVNRLALVKEQLCNVLRINNGCRNDRRAVQVTALCPGLTRTERRLHQLMFEDGDCESVDSLKVGSQRKDGAKPIVSIDHCQDKGYAVVSIQSRDRPRLLFDTVVTLTDMKYVVFHAAVSSNGPIARQEYYIRRADGCTPNTEGEKHRVVKCLEAAIQRRAAQGLRLEVRTSDRVGLLTDVTRVFRENGLSVTRADVSTIGNRVANTFFVTDSSGNEVDLRTIDRIRKEVGNVEISWTCKSMDCWNSNANDEERRSIYSLSATSFGHSLKGFSSNVDHMKVPEKQKVLIVCYLLVGILVSINPVLLMILFLLHGINGFLYIILCLM